MRQTLAHRTLIIGNGGSGKSTLAAQIAERLQMPLVGLDAIHWEDGGFARKRDEDAARQMVRDAAAANRWVMEGVYGWLSEPALPRATALVWLDLPWSECRAGLLARKSDQPMDADGLAWAEQYWARQTSSSFAGHRRIYDSFPGARLRLDSRRAVNALIGQL
jgi:adenylate kinase family enzyme